MIGLTHELRDDFSGSLDALGEFAVGGILCPPNAWEHDPDYRKDPERAAA